MVLGEPVEDSHGRVLARKGVTLSAQTVALLRAEGVTELIIEDAATPTELLNKEDAARQQQIAEATHAVRQKLDIRFRKFKDNELMGTLRAVAEKRLIQARLSDQT